MNIAEILKNCPEGTKLYSPVWGNVELVKVNALNNIEIRDSNEIKYIIYPNGKYSENGEVILFPSKEQCNWDEFLIPFKNGDVIITTDMTEDFPYENIAIFKEYREKNFRNKMIIHCQFDANGDFLPQEMDVLHKNWRLANAEEIQRFITRMNELGYDFKDGSLTRRFKYGDVVAFYNETWGGYNIGIFDKYLNNTFCKVLCITLVSDGSVKIVDENYNISKGWDTIKARYATHSEKLDLLEKLAKIGYEWNNNELTLIAKFKVGDVITNGKLTLRIDVVDSKHYIEGYPNVVYKLPISDQHHWKLKKFDTHSLKPYDRILAKTGDGCWYPTIVSYVEGSEVYLIDTTDRADYVIPFKGNEHLIGKFDDPDPYYITWE